MIYASDLDRTLIYSLSAIGVPEDSPGLVPAEIINGTTVSYISKEALSQLISLAGKIVFMPVTTRTVQQYQRINLFQETVIPEYAITSNGGNILIGGKVDGEWRESIGKLVEHHSAAAEEAGFIVRSALREEWIISERYCDGLFFTFVVQRDLLPPALVSALADELNQLGWKVSLQGRKLYAVPQAVNKSAAIEYVRRTIQQEPMVASGDSLLDKCLLDAADYAIAPCHGEIFAEHQQGLAESNYPFTACSGVFAGDEILQYVSTIYNNLMALGVGRK
ncbi:HAD family hydrolase [Paenibacillus sp. BR2-3]|uniref:HAD family hydrolase n=1 Tax=Paenibacillus sp. BR2-3 TaxID=3048494 RepID=UPI0039774BD7